MTEATAEAFTKIARGLYLEGLAVDHERDAIWYSDVIAGGIHGVKPDGAKVATLSKVRMWTGRVIVNADGGVLSIGEGGIMWNHPESGASGWLLDAIDGKPINGINEVAPNGEGCLFFGTSDLERVIRGQPARSSKIYHLSASRELTRLAEVGFSNGIMFDAQRRGFYCNNVPRHLGLRRWRPVRLLEQAELARQGRRGRHGPRRRGQPVDHRFPLERPRTPGTRWLAARATRHRPARSPNCGSAVPTCGISTSPRCPRMVATH